MFFYTRRLENNICKFLSKCRPPTVELARTKHFGYCSLTSHFQMETWEWLWEIFLILFIPRCFRVYFCSALGENKLKISSGTLEVHKSSSIVINFMRFTIASKNVMQNRRIFQVFWIQKIQSKGNFSNIGYEMCLYIYLRVIFVTGRSPNFQFKVSKTQLNCFCWC